jgi:hypothetical protein
MSLRICHIAPVSVSNFYASMLLLGTVAKIKLALSTVEAMEGKVCGSS